MITTYLRYLIPLNLDGGVQSALNFRTVAYPRMHRLGVRNLGSLGRNQEKSVSRCRLFPKYVLRCLQQQNILAANAVGNGSIYMSPVGKIPTTDAEDRLGGLPSPRRLAI